jgi:hypothetical protein
LKDEIRPLWFEVYGGDDIDGSTEQREQQPTTITNNQQPTTKITNNNQQQPTDTIQTSQLQISVNNFVAKMKRSAGNQIQDKSLNRLIDIGLPELRKGYTGMQSSPHVYDTNHEPAPISVEMEEIRFPETLFTVHDGNERSHLLKKLGRNDSFAYQTESEIQYLVQLAL